MYNIKTIIGLIFIFNLFFLVVEPHEKREWRDQNEATNKNAMIKRVDFEPYRLPENFFQSGGSRKHKTRAIDCTESHHLVSLASEQSDSLISQQTMNSSFPAATICATFITPLPSWTMEILLSHPGLANDQFSFHFMMTYNDSVAYDFTLSLSGDGTLITPLVLLLPPISALGVTENTVIESEIVYLMEFIGPFEDSTSFDAQLSVYWDNSFWPSINDLQFIYPTVWGGTGLFLPLPSTSSKKIISTSSTTDISSSSSTKDISSSSSSTKDISSFSSSTTSSKSVSSKLSKMSSPTIQITSSVHRRKASPKSKEVRQVNVVIECHPPLPSQLEIIPCVASSGPNCPPAQTCSDYISNSTSNYGSYIFPANTPQYQFQVIIDNSPIGNTSCAATYLALYINPGNPIDAQQKMQYTQKAKIATINTSQSSSLNLGLLIAIVVSIGLAGLAAILAVVISIIMKKNRQAQEPQENFPTQRNEDDDQCRLLR